ncbi:hypothetical protein D1B33_02320 [Lysinibacillus yapensis]|uniref:HEAT repeat domain-containing protein n=1 Tax=Ureibacillus yapensis TaxID=2304605 RepID=A0A396SL04_9BACL|nr:HEAT repeat domain-containing protein [Lysinibacillus yapensis]RHW39707.1 hypothetical protein D1B33_02320 [Lysinibacillus yapensis]
MIILTVEILLWVILALLVICFALILYLIIRRKVQERRKRAAKEYIEKTEGLWEAFLLEGGDFNEEQVPKNKSEIMAVEYIFLSYIQNMYNEEVSRKIGEFSNKYLLNYYEKELKGKNWGRRINALYKLIDFRLVELVPYIEGLSHKQKSKEEQFLLLKIYSIFNKDKFDQIILSNKYSFSEIEYKQIFSLLDESILLQLTNRLDEMQLNAQYALIDTVGYIGNIEFVQILEKLLDSKNSEIRIRSLKGIEKMGLVKNLELFLPFVTSPVWEERLMVAKVFLHVPLKFTLEHLMILLKDSNRQVRQQAASTFSNFPEAESVLNNDSLSPVLEDSLNVVQEMITRRL